MKKAQILQEIKRTAAANGGKPLGRAKFESQTGIKYCDWCGKYWANWGDAVREAGLPPNKLQTAYDRTELFENYVQLARELNRLPTTDDMRVKAHNTPGFPSHNTFARLGSKLVLVEQLTEYCRSRGYDDVVRLCEGYSPRKRAAPEESERREEQIGCVYLMKSGRFYKIGKTNAAGRREYELGIQLPEKVKTIHVIRTDDPSGIEEYWHKRFEAKHKNGEWFALDAADVNAFKRRKFM